jgi:hypothetical protein
MPRQKPLGRYLELMVTLTNKSTIQEIILLLFIPSILKKVEVSVSQAETDMDRAISFPSNIHKFGTGEKHPPFFQDKKLCQSTS